MKIVVNRCWGGFSISRAAAEWMEKRGHKRAAAELRGWREEKRWVDYFLKHKCWPSGCPKDRRGFLEIDAKYYKEPMFHGYGYVSGRGFGHGGYRRNDKTLVRAVETLGAGICSGKAAKLEVVEIPDGIGWEIEEYDGREWVSEKHHTW